LKYSINVDKTIIDSLEEADKLMNEGKIMEVMNIYKEIIPLATQGIAQSMLKADLIKEDEVDMFCNYFLKYSKGTGPEFIKDFVTGRESKHDEMRTKFLVEYAEYRKNPNQ